MSGASEADDQRDPTELPLDVLRSRRERLQAEDDAVSYARRVAQARLDLVNTARSRGERPADSELRDDLSEVLSQHLTGGPARPPRPTDDLSETPAAVELDEICAELGFSRLDELDADALVALGSALEEFEQRISSDRRERFEKIDGLTAELVRRYRDGEADVDALLAESDGDPDLDPDTDRGPDSDPELDPDPDSDRGPDSDSDSASG